MVTVRATMPNADEVLWPGTLVNAQLTLARARRRSSVPSAAVQVSQTGTSCSWSRTASPTVQPVKVERTRRRHESVIADGLEGGETVVTDGQLLLSNGTRVTPRAAQARGPDHEHFRSSASAVR